MCVRLYSENSEPTMLIFLTTPDEHPPTPSPCRWPALIALPTLASFGSFGAASVMCCIGPPACSSTPLRPSVHYPSVSLAVNIIYIQTFCENLHFVYIFDQADLDRVEVRLEFNGANARQIVSPPSLSSSHPRRHRQADGKLSPLTPSCQV